RNLTLGVEGDALAQVAVGDRGHDLCDTAHLIRQVGGHHVHVVCQILPGARNAPNLGVPAESAFRADLAGHPRHLRRKGVELIHHRVDGVLQFEDLPTHVYGDLAGEIAVRYGRRHVSDVADLRSQVAGHRVDRVRQVFPSAVNAAHVGLPTE